MSQQSPNKISIYLSIYGGRGGERERGEERERGGETVSERERQKTDKRQRKGGERQRQILINSFTQLWELRSMKSVR